MKVVIFLFQGVTALDAVGPYELISRLPNADVLFVAKEVGPVRTGDGFLALHADADLAATHHADALLIPGGSRQGLASIIRDPDVLKWVRDLDAESGWTCSVCTGSLLLAASGVLAGRKVATHWRAKDALHSFGAEYSPDRVVIDGKYMTSAGVSAGIDLGLLYCAEVAGRNLAEAVQLSVQYDPQPPFDAGDPLRATPEQIRLVETGLRQ